MTLHPKGDLDICVSVPAEEFSPAIEILSVHFVIHRRENWTGGLASFA